MLVDNWEWEVELWFGFLDNVTFLSVLCVWGGVCARFYVIWDYALLLDALISVFLSLRLVNSSFTIPRSEI